MQLWTATHTAIGDRCTNNPHSSTARQWSGSPAHAFAIFRFKTEAGTPRQASPLQATNHVVPEPFVFQHSGAIACVVAGQYVGLAYSLVNDRDDLAESRGCVATNNGCSIYYNVTNNIGQKHTVPTAVARPVVFKWGKTYLLAYTKVLQRVHEILKFVEVQ